MNFSTQITDASARACLARNEWLEDTIMSAMCARLPVSHVTERRGPMLLDDPVLYDDAVVLVGGHVFGRRVVRLVTAPRRSPQA